MVDSVIRTDGTTVWVDVGSYTVGRFGKMGIDVHTATADGYLHCTHEPTTREDWRSFVTSMAFHHDVTIPDEYMPTRFR